MDANDKDWSADFPPPTWRSPDGAALLYLGDCLELLPKFPPGSIDAVVTDPPYNCGKRYGKDCDDAREPEVYIAWLRDIYRACAAIAPSLITFPGLRNLLDVPAHFAGTGLHPWRILGWHKREFAGDKWNGGPAMCWEPIIWAVKEGHSPAFNERYGTLGRDFLVVDSVHGDPDAVLHPCPKPLKVLLWLIGLFVPEHGFCVDPLAGTGRTGLACAQLGRRFVGIEIEPKYLEIAKRRIAAECAQGKLALKECAQGKLALKE